MDNYRKRALRCGSTMLGLLFTGALFLVVGLWPMTLVCTYLTVLTGWTAWRSSLKAKRRKMEIEWWARAKKGIEQEPLNPCCLEFDETGYLHDEAFCTRYRYKRPKPLTRQERIEIDEAWAEIVAHLKDQDFGENS